MRHILRSEKPVRFESPEERTREMILDVIVLRMKIEEELRSCNLDDLHAALNGLRSDFALLDEQLRARFPGDSAIRLRAQATGSRLSYLQARLQIDRPAVHEHTLDDVQAELMTLQAEIEERNRDPRYARARMLSSLRSAFEIMGETGTAI